MSKKNQVYDVESIETLPPIQAIRKRPHMYIGKTDSDGLHHLIREIVDNSVDEVLAGYCNKITVTIHKDQSVTVTDNGRGIPCGINSKGNEVLEEMFTTTHSGGKFNNDAYTVSGGLHGVGTTIVNALSIFCHIVSKREGLERELMFENAVGQGLKTIGKTKETGTLVHFLPDPLYFDDITFDYDKLRVYLTEKAYLNPAAVFVLLDERTNDYDEIHKKEGLKDMLSDLTEGYKHTSDILNIVTTLGDTSMNIVLRFMNSSDNIVKSYANSIPTSAGGSHLEATNKALCEVINSIGIKFNIINKNEPLRVPDIKDGLGMVVAVTFPKIAYESQTKDKLSVPEVYKNVYEAMCGDVKLAIKNFGNNKYLHKMNSISGELCALPNIKDIIKRLVEIRSRKEHSKSAKGASNNKGSKSNPNIKDCLSKNPFESEIFIVEGDSAGGTAGSARDLMTQAVVKLRGKIKNVSKANIKDIYKSLSVMTMIQAFGCGAGPDFNLDKLKYHKIILLTDADVDGAHIRSLLINFFFRYMRPLLLGGYIYVAQPPLYGIKDSRSNKIHYAFTRPEMDTIVEEHFKNKPYSVTRYKGLGEMNADQLKDTTMDKFNRRLIQLVIDDKTTEEEMEKAMNDIFEEDVDYRREMIDVTLKERRDIALKR